MSFELRPLSLAEILDVAFQLVQTGWKTLIGLSLIIQIPIVLLGLWAPWIFDPLAQPLEVREGMTADALIEMVAGIGGLGVLSLLLYPFVAAAVTASVGNVYLGRRFEIGDAARAGLRALFRLIASYVVWLLAYGAAILLVVGVGALSFAVIGSAIEGFFDGSGGFESVVAIVLALGAGGFALYWLMFATVVSSLLAPIVVLESKGILGTVKRAFSLGATSKWRLIGIVGIAGMIVGIPVFAAQTLIATSPVPGLFVWAAFQAVGFAFTSAVQVVLYFDLRCRAENFDLESLGQLVKAGPGFRRGELL